MSTPLAAWALQQLGESLPTGVQEYGTSVVQEGIDRLHQSPLFAAGAYLGGATPEMVAEEQRRAAEAVKAAQAYRANTNVGRAVGALTGNRPTSAPPAVSPPTTPKPEPTVVAPPAQPQTRTKIRLVTDPNTGREAFVAERVPAADVHEGGADQQWLLEEWKRKHARPGVNPQTVGNISGEVNPLGFSTRSGPGTYSYMGTQGFDPTRKYEEADFRALHPLEQREILEREQAAAQLRSAQLGAREADAMIRMREAAADEATDPVGYHNKLVQQQVAVGQQALQDPNSVLSVRFRAGLLEYKTKYPNATPEQLQEFAQLLQAQLVQQEAERVANIMTPSVRGQVQVAQARGNMFYGMPGMMPTQ